MNCPYCAEEIKDEAIVCRYCQKDFFFLKPILARLSKADDAITALGSEIEDLKGANTLSSDLRPTSRLRDITIAAILSISLSIVFYWLSWQDIVGDRFDAPLEGLSAGSPFLAALWLGFCTSSLRLSRCVLIGLALGIAGFIQFFFLNHEYANLFNRLYFLLNKTPFTVDAPIKQIPEMLCAYIGAGTCLFPTGYAIGEHFGNRNRGIKTDFFKQSKSSNSLVTMASALSPLLVALLGVVSSVAAAMIKTK